MNWLWRWVIYWIGSDGQAKATTPVDGYSTYDEAVEGHSNFYGVATPEELEYGAKVIDVQVFLSQEDPTHYEPVIGLENAGRDG